MDQSYPTAVPGLQLQFASLSDLGCRRKKNEDFEGIANDGEDGSFLLVVADGVGGNSAGEVASQLAVETYCQSYEARDRNGSLGDHLLNGMLEANRVILEQAAGDPKLAGMATTCTAALIRGGELWIGHVGDCRAYLVHAGQLFQLTQDHSVAAEYESQGQELPPDKKHLRNVLTRCLGFDSEVQVDVYDPVAFEKDSIVVICSDGLTKVVSSDEILYTVSMHLPGRACKRMVELARERGGPDNITVQVARYAKE